MALEYKQIEAKAIAVADTDETFYTVSASQRVVGQMIVANTSSSNNRTFRVAVVGDGDTLGAEHYITYDSILVAGEIVTISGLTLGAGDSIIIRSDAASTTPGTGLTFQLYGELDTAV